MTEWNCSCGDVESSCHGESIICRGCNTGHHEACAFDLLKGVDSVGKFALLRSSSFKCINCEPSRYSWMFNCKCIDNGNSVVMDFDDGGDMSECLFCHRWSQDDEPECQRCLAVKNGKSMNIPFKWYRFVPRGSSSSRGKKRYNIEPLEPLRSLFPNKVEIEGTVSSESIDKRHKSTNLCKQSVQGGMGDQVSKYVKLIKVPRLVKGIYIRKNSSFRDEKIVDEVVVRGLYERPLFDFEVLPSDTWLDLGAHIGVFSSLCLQVGADVISVEPDPSNFELLVLNSNLNITRPGQSTLINGAVMNEKLKHNAGKYTIQLYLHPTIGFRHSTINKRRSVPWESTTVPLTNLTSILHAHPAINSVKIDIQGSEIQVIESIKNWQNVEKLVFEYDFEYSPDLKYFHTFIKKLKDYFPYVYHPKLKRTGSFVGFPNGVLVYAKKNAPLDING